MHVPDLHPSHWLICIPASPRTRWQLVGLLFTCLTLAFSTPAWPSIEEKVIDGVPHILNSGPPPEGRQVLNLEELWRRGSEEDEVFFGNIAEVLADTEGNIYVLDQQQSHVEVFSPQGKHLRTLSREGEGPGEVNRPQDMVIMPDGTLGIAQYLGDGRIVRISLDGTPAGTITPPGSGAEGGGIPRLIRVRYRGGNLVVNGVRTVPMTDGLERTQYLASWTAEGQLRTTYLERTTITHVMTEGWIERQQYFPEMERWALGPDGRVYAACERDKYAIRVFAQDGTLDLIIEGPHQPYRRTAEEKQALADALIAISEGERIQIKSEIEDFAPAISEVWVQEDGSLWVLPGSGSRGQPAGVMQTYDVFDRRGVFVRQLQIACEGDPRQDRLIFFAPGRVALIRGARDAQQSMFGGSAGASNGDEEAPVHEVVIYRYETR